MDSRDDSRWRTRVKENVAEFGNLSYQGRRRLGLRELILPEIARLLRDYRPVRYLDVSVDEFSGQRSA